MFIYFFLYFSVSLLHALTSFIVLGSSINSILLNTRFWLQEKHKETERKKLSFSENYCLLMTA